MSTCCRTIGAAADLRERQQVVDQVAHPPRVDLDALERSPAIGIELVAVILLEDLNEAGNGADRRAQVVRHRVAERFELAVGRAQFGGAHLDAMLELGAGVFDLLGHRVERLGQPAQLVLPMEVDVDRRPRFGHRFGRLGDLAQRRGQQAAQHPADDRGNGQQNQRDHRRPSDKTIGGREHGVAREFDQDLPRRRRVLAPRARACAASPAAGNRAARMCSRCRSAARRTGCARLVHALPSALPITIEACPPIKPASSAHGLLALRGVGEPAALDDVAEHGCRPSATRPPTA